MANKAKKTKKTSAKREEDANVVRIRATAPAASSKSVETAEKVEKTVKPAVKTTKAEASAKPKKAKNGNGLVKVLSAIGGYFKGAWVELRQVRWPNRRATWGLTGAVILYSAFFVVFVLLLDAGFKYVFELILKK